MQYRWVGQVSEGERAIMQRNLETPQISSAMPSTANSA